MIWNEVIELVYGANFVNDGGDNIDTLKYKEIFANKKSIGQKEFYEAQTVGLKPEIKFVIRAEEYDDNKKVRYKEKIYNVVRTYCKNDFVELILQGDVIDGDTESLQI